MRISSLQRPRIAGNKETGVTEDIKPTENHPALAGGAPRALGTRDSEKPSLDIYLTVAPASGSAVVVVLGGSYAHLALDHEGAQIARWLNDRAVAAFVLHYRVAPRYHYPAPILDGERAMRYVRAHAAEFSIHPVTRP